MRVIEGKIHIPPGLQTDPHFIMPDEIVAICADTFNLANKKMLGIDPLCGVGTIPRVIYAKGGRCDGIEVDPRQYTVAKAQLPQDASLTLGDCLNLVPQHEGSYDYIYTSVPFEWFKNASSLPSPKLAEAFVAFLKPAGMLIIDTTDAAPRGNEVWHIADAQIKYFTDHGFTLQDTLKFKTASKQGEVDDQFTELCFIKGSA